MAKCDIHNHIYQNSSTCMFCDAEQEGMLRLMNDVQAFHIACDVPVATTPTVPDLDTVSRRRRLIAEEVIDELLPAMLKDDLIGVADGIADAIYVLVGTALEYGIPLDRVWQAVQRANMAKVGADGKVRKRADGKVLKPEGWTPPDIASLLVVKEADT